MFPRGGGMTRPTRCADEDVAAWLAANPSWSRDGDALVREVSFPTYAAAISFVVALAFEAERRDHHPDLVIAWRRVTVRWTTHDAGGISPLDLALAETTSALVR